MSHEVDEYYDVYNETERKARKEHQCGACDETIRAGDVYHRIFIIDDGEVSAIVRCARCQAIHLHLRSLADDMWPDERLNCGEEYKDHWGKEPPEEIAALAFATPQELQQQVLARSLTLAADKDTHQ